MLKKLNLEKFAMVATWKKTRKAQVIGGDWYYVASTNRLESIGAGIMHESSKTNDINE